MPSLVEIVPVVLQKKIRKCEKFTDRWTTGDQESSVQLKTLSACT